jgi:hypothetical protein
MELDDIPELELPDAMDAALDAELEEPQRYVLGRQGASMGRVASMELIFTLDGLSETSSNPDDDDNNSELSLRELFGCDEDEEQDGLESPADVSMVGTCSHLEAIEEWQESSEASAPIKAVESQLGTSPPILMALLRASSDRSSCSTRESTPSPKAHFGQKFRREVKTALYH